MIGIYKIINLKNNKVYIGQSINIKKRWNSYKNRPFFKYDSGYNTAIYAAIRKYGLEYFQFEVIEVCLEEELDKKEQYWIEKTNSLIPNGYNILRGGKLYERTPNKCIECGEPVHKKNNLCRICSRRRTRVVEWPEPLIIGQLVKEKGFVQTGKQFGVTDNAVKKWCKSYGIPYLKQELIKWYNDQIGVETKIKQKQPYKRPVQQLDLKNNIVNVFDSASSAARFFGRKEGSNIIRVCRGQRETAYGYKWQYLDTEE